MISIMRKAIGILLMIIMLIIIVAIPLANLDMTSTRLFLNYWYLYLLAILFCLIGIYLLND